MKYSTSFRNGILKKVLPPENRSVYAGAKEAGISAITINGWLAKIKGEANPVCGVHSSWNRTKRIPHR